MTQKADVSHQAHEQVSGKRVNEGVVKGTISQVMPRGTEEEYGPFSK